MAKVKAKVRSLWAPEVENMLRAPRECGFLLLRRGKAVNALAGREWRKECVAGGRPYVAVFPPSRKAPWYGVDCGMQGLNLDPSQQAQVIAFLNGAFKGGNAFAFPGNFGVAVFADRLDECVKLLRDLALDGGKSD